MLKLEKWYFDCNNQDKQLLIAYAARLKLYGVSIPWSSILLNHFEAQELSQGIYRHHIEQNNHNIQLKIPHEDFSAVWTPTHNSLASYQLINNDICDIQWQVFSPISSVSVDYKNSTMAGMGYVERLSLSLKQASLPFHTLRWGRFIADNLGFYCVWIQWQGETDQVWVITAEGQTAEVFNLDDESLKIAQGELRFEAQQVIVDTSIGQHLPKWLSLLPFSSLMQAREQKYLSSARWTDSNGQTIAGWAIHEKVVWKKDTL